MPTTRKRHDRRTLTDADRDAIAMLASMTELAMSRGSLDAFLAGWYHTTEDEGRACAEDAIAQVKHFLWPSEYPKPERTA